MNSLERIKAVFANSKAFLPFITAGDPDLETTVKLVPLMARAGADLIEIGIPFSDPVAEGEVIQKADQRALAAGVTADLIFETVRRIRQNTPIPLAFMTYFNPIFVYGRERFLKNCAACGVDALIVPDLPFEEKDELLPYCEKEGVVLISLIAPTSKERISLIAKEARGFVYCISSLGVTGVRSEIGATCGEMIRLVKAAQDIPCAVGFGISTPEQAKAIAQTADGVIVGSAVVKIVAQYGRECLPAVADYVAAIKSALT